MGQVISNFVPDPADYHYVKAIVPQEMQFTKRVHKSIWEWRSEPQEST